MSKRGLVMSGGGSLGAFTQGVMVAMGESGLDYEHVFGVSVGALQAALLAQYPIGGMHDAAAYGDEIWLNQVQGDRSIYKRWPMGVAAALWKDSLYDSRPLWKLIREHCDEQMIRESGRTLRMGCCAHGRGCYWEATEQTPNLADWVIASSAYAPFFLPIEIDGDLWYDGGYRCVTPLRSAIRFGCEEIDVILTSPPVTREESLEDNWAGTKRNALKIGMRNIGLMHDEIFRRDVERALLVNDLVEVDHCTTRGKRWVSIRLFVPDYHFAGGGKTFAPEKIRERRKHGIEVGRRVIKETHG
jgi:NTE family protein